MKNLKINNNSYKIGVDEIDGLKETMKLILSPVQEHLKKSVYWNDVEFDEAEYKHRSGFIPYSSNCGGIMIDLIIPKCEEYNFSFLEFGDCEDCNETMCSDCGEYCVSESDGHLDARLRVWFKFEGISNNKLNFYLIMDGGNNDASYFRSNPTIFETEFSCKDLEDLKVKSKKHINKLIKAMR